MRRRYLLAGKLLRIKGSRKRCVSLLWLAPISSLLYSVPSHQVPSFPDDMFTFTKLPVCVLLALLSVKGVQGAPIDIKGIIESVIENLPNETDNLGNLVQTSTSTSTVSDVAIPTTSANATGIFTVVTSAGGPAITLAQNGSTTVFNGATYTVEADAAAATSAVGNVAFNSTEPTNSTASASASDSASASGSTDSASGSATSSGSASASTTTSAASSASSGASSVSSASSSAKSASSSSAKPNGGTALRPVEFSTPLARGLLTVALGIAFGAWCL
ncbi:hypothetical protein C8R44DRAFT_990548 [Mycena epipterygia]|nr:hypothetical protein C8R44DRAFT_990548 [Mycena epipterygia]